MHALLEASKTLMHVKVDMTASVVADYRCGEVYGICGGKVFKH
jgi:hypothetical protein